MNDGHVLNLEEAALESRIINKIAKKRALKVPIYVLQKIY